jgi:hypothetical protein
MFYFGRFPQAREAGRLSLQGDDSLAAGEAAGWPDGQ